MPDTVRRSNLLDQARAAFYRARFQANLQKLRGDQERLAADDDLLAAIHFGWNNGNWPAGVDLMRTCIQRARHTTGHIVECGSGLSTLLMGLAAAPEGRQVWALEHHEDWFHRMRREIKRQGLDNVHLVHAPLKSYGDFDWYDIDPAQLPRPVGLLLVDGPPADTKGGRRGALSLLAPIIHSPCTIIVDDVDREDELLLLRDWARQLNAEYQILGRLQDFAVMPY